MGRLIGTTTSLLLIITAGFFSHANKNNQAQNRAESSPGQVDTSKKLVLEVLETDSGPGGGSNQFVFLRAFSDRSIEFHPKRSEDLKKVPVSRGEISQAQLEMILAVVGREDVMKLPDMFKTTYTPIDFHWTLDMKIPRGTQVQQIKLVNFFPAMAKQNNMPYPEALMRLACSVLALRRSLNADTPDSDGTCRDFVSNH